MGKVGRANLLFAFLFASFVGLVGYYYADVLRLIILAAFVFLFVRVEVRGVTVSLVQRFSYPLYGFVALASWALISIMWSVNWRYTITYWQTEILTGIYLFLVGMLLRRRLSFQTLQFLVVAGWLTTMWLGILYIGRWPHPFDLFRPGIWGVQSYYVGALVLILPALLDVQLRMSQRGQLLWPFALFLLWALIAYLTLIRMVWVVFLVLLMVYVVTHVWRTGLRFSPASSILIFLMIAFALSSFELSSLQKPPSWEYRNAAPETLGAFTKSERWDIWLFWFERGMRHMWQGLGYGLYNPTVTYGREHPPRMSPEFFTHAHNVFIDIWLQTGIVGLVLLCVFIAVLLYWFWRRVPDSAAAVSGVVLVLAPFVRDLTDESWNGANAQLWWLLLGVWAGEIMFKSDKICHRGTPVKRFCA